MNRAAMLILASLLITDFAVAQDTDHAKSSSASFVKGSPITSKVKNKLDADKSLSGIEVETDKQSEVWLSGTVDSKDVAQRAVDIAKNTEGVKAVHDYIDVRTKGQ